MSDYFNATGTIGFTCDNCGRELLGCTWVNGMKFCAKCYQETFGTNTKEITYVYGGNLKEHTKVIEEKDKKISDLEAKLADVKNSCDYYMKRSNDLVREIGEYKKHIRFKGKEITELKQQLADKETRIAELEDKDWYEGTIKQLEEQNERLIKQLAEKDLRIEELESQFAYECECNKQFVDCQNENAQLKQQLAEKDEQLRAKIGNMKSNDFIKMCLQCGLMVDAKEKDNQDKISFCIEKLEKIDEFVKSGYCFELDDVRNEIDNQIKAIKEKK